MDDYHFSKKEMDDYADASSTVRYSSLLKDFFVAKTIVIKYPSLKITIVDGKQEASVHAQNQNDKDEPLKVVLPLIIKPNGMLAFIENTYLHWRSNSARKYKYETLEREAMALMSFCRFCHGSQWSNPITNISEQLTYRSLTGNTEQGAPSLFGDFLFDHLQEIDVETGIVIKNGYAPSTAMFYVRVVASFYSWLMSSKILTINEDYKPYNKRQINFVRNNKDGGYGYIDEDMLSHLNSNEIIKVDTSDLVQRFVNSPLTNSVEAHKKLKPMTPDDRQLFAYYLDNKAPLELSLMSKLSIEVGLRVNEVITFPESQISDAHLDLDVIKVSIGEHNGCKTKFGTPRTVEVPSWLMEELLEYKFSDKRIATLEMKGIEFDENDNQIGNKAHGRLFTSRKGTPYAKNTFQHFISTARTYLNQAINDGILDIAKNELKDIASEVQIFHEEKRKLDHKAIPRWYYRPHDLRSTFATRWLLNESQDRNCPIEDLLDELAELMGHKSSIMTKKYINFLNEKMKRFNQAKNKNTLLTASLY